MAGYVMRKNQRLMTFATLKYHGCKLAGEGIIKDFSMNGSRITGNVPVTVGMVLALQIFVPGVSELLVIDRATVKWVKRAEFGVYFDNSTPEVVERITQVISTLIKRQRSSSSA